MEDKVQFSLRTRVTLARGAFAETAGEALRLGRRILIVTGRAAMRRAGLLDRLARAIEAAGGRPVLFDRVFPNPTTDLIDEGAALARREKAEVVVGLGGGSAMDTAKAVAVAAGFDRPAADLFANLPGRVAGLPVVAVPTTSGTGSEVTAIAVMTDPGRRRKIGVFNEGFYPVAAILDPELTVTMPPGVTAGSGMDALAHAMESYLSKKADAFSSLFAEEAVRLVFRHLERACRDGGDLEARTGMALASLMAGVALGQAGTIIGHAAGMGLGGVMDLDHGAVVGVLLPEALSFTLPHGLPCLARLARRTGLAPPAEADDEEAAGALLAAVRRLAAELPIPRSLAAMGCDPARLPDILQNTMEQRALGNLPAAPAPSEVEEFLRRVLRPQGD